MPTFNDVRQALQDSGKRGPQVTSVSDTIIECRWKGMIPTRGVSGVKPKIYSPVRIQHFPDENAIGVFASVGRKEELPDLLGLLRWAGNLSEGRVEIRNNGDLVLIAYLPLDTLTGASLLAVVDDIHVTSSSLRYGARLPPLGTTPKLGWLGYGMALGYACPFCSLQGGVYCMESSSKKGFSTSKATSALLTGGVSLLFTGLAKVVVEQNFLCEECGLSR
jgi:hypothetical protein